MKTQKIHKINYYLALNIPKFNKKKNNSKNAFYIHK